MSNKKINTYDKNDDTKDGSHFYMDVLEPIEAMNNTKEYETHIYIDDIGDPDDSDYPDRDENNNMDKLFIQKLNNDLEKIRKDEKKNNTYKKNNLFLNIQSSSEDSNDLNSNYLNSNDLNSNDLNQVLTRGADIYKNINSPVSMLSHQGSDNYPSDSENDDSTFFKKSSITFRKGCDIDYYFGDSSDPSSISDDNNHPAPKNGYNSRASRVHYLDKKDSPPIHIITEKKENILDIVEHTELYQSEDFKLLSFRDVEKNIHQYYSADNDITQYNEIDILLTYLKGQKNLYFHANSITQIKLNFLTIPAVVLTVAVIIIAPFITTFSWGGGFISAINSLIVLCITLANRLKLESETTMFFFLANQYDKLHSSLEVAGNRMSFFIKFDKNMNGSVNDNRTRSHKEGFKLKLKEVESKLSEIKESNVTLLPDIVKKLFPVISHINIFSFFKKIDNVKKNTIFKLRNVKNEIRFIIFKWNKKGINILEEESCISGDIVKERNRLFHLMQIKEKIKEDILYLNSSFEIIDDIFSREIKYAESKKNVILLLFGCEKPKIEEYNYSNPIVKEYLKPIC
jgi:hypothetical protein